MDFWEIYDRYYARVRGYAASMLRDESGSPGVRAEATRSLIRDGGLSFLARRPAG